MKRIKVFILILASVFMCNFLSANILDNIAGTLSSALDAVKSVVGLTESFTTTSGSSSVNTSNTEASYKILAQMVADYQNNSLRAETAWVGKDITLTVKFDNIEDVDGTQKVFCTAGTIGEGFFNVIFEIQDAKKAAELNNGQVIKVEGKLQKYDPVANYNISLDDARIIS